MNQIHPFLLFALLFPFLGMAADAEKEVAQAKKLSAKLSQEKLKTIGLKVFQQRCQRCHGKGGVTPPGSAALDLAKGIYKFRTTPSGSNPRDADLWRTITRGVAGTRMPGFGFLSKTDRLALIGYIKSLSDYFEDEDEPTAVEIPSPPKWSHEQVQAGRQWYLIQRCQECHGPSGRGDGPMARTLKDGQGRLLRPASFAGLLKSGPRARDLYRTLLTGLDGTPMAAFGAGTFAMGLASQRLKSKTGVRYPAVEAAAKFLNSKEQAKLRNFIDKLPSQKKINSLNRRDKLALEAKRRWALVYYLQSLRGKKE